MRTTGGQKQRSVLHSPSTPMPGSRVHAQTRRNGDFERPQNTCPCRMHGAPRGGRADCNPHRHPRPELSRRGWYTSCAARPVLSSQPDERERRPVGTGINSQARRESISKDFGLAHSPIAASTGPLCKQALDGRNPSIPQPWRLECRQTAAPKRSFEAALCPRGTEQRRRNCGGGAGGGRAPGGEYAVGHG